MKMNVGVALLCVIFGWSSWIDVGGIWVELPVIVNKLPEGWNLPAYFIVIIALANIGPLTYALVKYVFKRCRFSETAHERLETGAIFIIISVGVTAMFLLAFIWDRTTLVGGVDHSTALLLLIFFLALVDCTSSVTFLPFMSRLNARYLTAFFIGEGMSGLLPTALAFMQGSGEYTCVNSSANGTFSILPEYKPLLFTVRDFFIALSAMLLMSMIAFLLLKYSTYCKTEYVGKQEHKTDVQNEISLEDPSNCDREDNSELHDSSSDSIEYRENNSMSRCQYITLLCIISFLSFNAYGWLPSIQTYSLLPYGHTYYNLAVKLSILSAPLACFIGFAPLPHSFIAIGAMTAIVAALSSYITFIASYSPQPPIEGTVAAIIMVVVWTVSRSLISFMFMYISQIMMAKAKDGRTALFWIGTVTQIGSFVGSILSFTVTTILLLFESAPPC